MSTSVISISPDDTIARAAQMMSRNNKVSCIIVVDDAKVVGILTETDIINSVAGGESDFDTSRVAELMSSPVEIVSPSFSILEAAEITERKHIKQLPVLKDQQLIGIVTQTDLVRVMTSYGVWRDVSEIMNRNVIGIHRWATSAVAADVMTSHNISCIVALQRGEAVGILTERDILSKLVARHRDPTQTTVEEIMSSPVISVPPHHSVYSANATMEAEGIRRLVVTEGTRLCGIVSQTDIFRATWRKLRSEENENARSLEKTRNNMYTIDLDGKTTYVNPALLRLFEVTDPHEFVDQPFLPERFWFAPANRAGLLTEIRQGNDVIKELALKTSKGKRVYVTLFSTLTKNVRGEINGSQGILYDVTEKKELVALRKAERDLRVHAEALVSANTSLEQSKKAAEAATQAKSEFLANMSHEIRTPMTAVLGFSEILMASAANQEQLDAATTIKQNGEYLIEIINDILDLSKIESGKLEVERSPCSPCQILSQVVSLMRVRANAKKLPLEVEYFGPIPQRIQSDPTRLRQILINLIGNAIKFTEVGEIRVVARLLDADSDEPRIQFDVVDTGIGMTDQQLDKLFQPFFQADSSATREFGGTGLGLAISQRLAETLGGSIRVHSIPGEGSTFSVTVSTGPLEGVTLVDNPTEAEFPTEQVAKPADGDVRLDCRVLLAEDGHDNQRLITFVLKKAGADLTVTENGQLALDLALEAREDENTFDVILMDMQMPVMDGYEATGRLREAGYTGPIIALTAHAMSTDRDKCLNAGCDAYMAKPIDHKNLVLLVAEYASRQELGNASGTPVA